MTDGYPTNQHHGAACAIGASTQAEHSAANASTARMPTVENNTPYSNNNLTTSEHGAKATPAPNTSHERLSEAERYDQVQRFFARFYSAQTLGRNKTPSQSAEKSFKKRE